jgi:hypothetical protein
VDSHLLNATLVVVYVMALVATYVVVTRLVCQRLSQRYSYWLIIGLSVLMSFVWWLAGIVAFFVFIGLSSDVYGKPEWYVYQWTFGLSYKLCDLLPEFRPLIGSDFCTNVVPFLSATLFFLIVAMIVKRFSKSRKKVSHHSG